MLIRNLLEFNYLGKLVESKTGFYNLPEKLLAQLATTR